MNRTIRFCMGMLPLLLGSIAAPAGADRDENVYTVDPDVDIEIEILQGSIEISGWDRDEVRVRTRGDGAEGISVEAERDWVSIRPSGGMGWLAFGGSVDLRIEVPHDSRVQARALNGRIRADGIKGSLSLHTVNGGIDVRGAPRETYMETVSSSIDFDGEGERSDARVDARSMSGSIDLRDVGGEVTANSMSGSIKLRDAKLERADLVSMSGSIDVDAEIEDDARVSARTHSGSINFTLPDSTQAHFEATTRSGRIKNELGGKARKRRGSQRLDFSVGQSDSRITLENTRGSIRIRSRD